MIGADLYVVCEVLIVHVFVANCIVYARHSSNSLSKKRGFETRLYQGLLFGLKLIEILIHGKNCLLYELHVSMIWIYFFNLWSCRPLFDVFVYSCEADCIPFSHSSFSSHVKLCITSDEMKCVPGKDYTALSNDVRSVFFN